VEAHFISSSLNFVWSDLSTVIASSLTFATAYGVTRCVDICQYNKVKKKERFRERERVYVPFDKLCGSL
jgi:hypothetical protein